MASTAKHGSRQRRRPPRRIREHQRRRDGRAPAPGYEFAARVYEPRAWNQDPRRFRLAERACPLGYLALVIETKPRDATRADDGVLLVAHAPANMSDDELVIVIAEGFTTVAAMMNKKFGRAGWWPAAFSAPEPLLAILLDRLDWPRS